jgi:hypothetical protein
MVEEEDSGSVDDFPKATFHQAVEDARKQLRDFYQPSERRHQRQFENLTPMPIAQTHERIFYQAPIDTKLELTELVEAELTKGAKYVGMI